MFSKQIRDSQGGPPPSCMASVFPILWLLSSSAAPPPTHHLFPCLHTLVPNKNSVQGGKVCAFLIAHDKRCNCYRIHNRRNNVQLSTPMSLSLKAKDKKAASGHQCQRHHPCFVMGSETTTAGEWIQGEGALPITSKALIILYFTCWQQATGCFSASYSRKPPSSN